MKITTWGTLCLFAVAASSVNAQSTLLMPTKKQLRRAHIKRVAPCDESGRRVGPWRTLISNDDDPDTNVFDRFESAGTGSAPDQHRGLWGASEVPAWDQGTRLSESHAVTQAVSSFRCLDMFKGSASNNMNDFAHIKGVVRQMSYAWQQNVTEPFTLIINIYDNFYPTLTGGLPYGNVVFINPGVNTFGGWILDYGNLPAGSYYDYADLSGGGGGQAVDGWIMPNDGEGAVRFRFCSATSPSVVGSTDARPLDWVVKPGFPDNGSQPSNTEWRKQSQTATAWSAADSANFNYGVFPAENTQSKPYGLMTGFYADYAHHDAAGAVTTVMGTRFSGNLNSLSAADGNKYCAFDDDTSLETGIQISATSQNPNPSKLWVNGISNVARTGLTQEILVHDNTLAQDTLVDSREASLSNDPFSVEVVAGAANGSVATDYINGFGNVITTIHTYPFNDETPSQDGWLSCVDWFYIQEL